MHLEIKNLEKFYSKEIPIIKKLNFSVNKGNIISFIGESGSGKTTLLKCISGLEKINSGSILLNGHVLNNDKIFVKPQERKIGFIFQDYPLFPHLNLKENILFNLKDDMLIFTPKKLGLYKINLSIENIAGEIIEKEIFTFNAIPDTANIAILNKKEKKIKDSSIKNNQKTIRNDQVKTQATSKTTIKKKKANSSKKKTKK